MNAANESVLVIESDEAFRHDLARLLEGAGYDISTSETSEGGLRIAREKGVDLVLLDEQFSGLERSDVVAEFKGGAATADIRVILLSSGAVGARVRGRDLGANDVVTRPWEPGELPARVRTQFARQEGPG
jgi:DNA-binding response OmpR family regulator